MKKIFSGMIIVFGLLLLSSHNVDAAGVTYNFSDSGTWNIRFDGPDDGVGSALHGALSYAGVAVGDINGDGDQDLVISARRADFNGRADSGSIYIIDHDLYASLGATGNTIDLNDSSNYTIRYDSAAASEQGGRSVVLEDVTGDDLVDLIFVNYIAGNNGRASSGSAYIIGNDLLNDNYSGTGNNVDLADSDNWNIRYDGTAMNSLLGSVSIGDLNNNNQNDIVLTEGNAKHVFVIYDDLIQSFVGTGNTVDLADSDNWNIRYDKATAPSFDYDSVRIADYDDDDKNDLLLGTPGGFVGSLYLVANTLIDDYVGTGNIVDLTDSNNWNIRYDGGLFLGELGGLTIGDLNQNGKNDLVIADAGDNNPSAYSGSVYVIMDDLIDDYAGTGNTVDLTVDTNFSFEFYGATAGNFGAFQWYHISGSQYRIADLDNNGLNDLVINDSGNTVFNVPDTGKAYVIFDAFFIGDGFDVTGNTVNLSSNNNWQIKYVGEGASDWLGASALELKDINGDGGKDVVIGAWGAGFTDTGSGSLYIIYYFPHTITFDDVFNGTSGVDFSITGTIEAPDNPTTISGVEYGLSADFDGSWFSCSAEDGDFDSNSEEFRCDLSALGTPMQDIYLRAFDSKGIWTPLGHYSEETFTTETPFSAITAISPDGTHLTITWDTDGASSSQVEYGLTNAYGNTTAESDLTGVTTHSVTISGLAACTYYHYRVISTDVAENTATSSDFSVRTSGCSSGGGGGGGSSRSVVQQLSGNQSGDSENTNLGDTGVGGQSGRSSFRDVPDDSWFAEFVEVLRKAGIVEGYGENKDLFLPENPITRAELTKMLVLLTGNTPSLEVSDFIDMHEHWAEGFVEMATTLGWIQGYADGSFHPDQPVTRAEAAKIISLAFNLSIPEIISESSFPDVSPSDWFAPFVEKLFSLGILQGYADGTFHPSDFITRAEAAKIIVKTAEAVDVEL